MNAVAKREDEPRSLQFSEGTSEAGGLMAVIAQAARDPNVDVDKLERLMGLYERMEAKSAREQFTVALAEMQPELPVITERGEIRNNAQEVQSRYARWEDINDAVRPVLHKHGFALNFRTGAAADGKIAVTGVLSHRAGHSEETTIALTHDSSGSKNGVQAIGSSVSYGKRYTAIALLNITSRAPQDQDDDGETAGMSPAVAAAKAAIELCETGAELALWKRENEPGIRKLAPKDADAVVRLYNARAKKLKQAASQGTVGQ